MNEEKRNQKCILIEVKERFVSFKLETVMLERVLKLISHNSQISKPLISYAS